MLAADQDPQLAPAMADRALVMERGWIVHSVALSEDSVWRTVGASRSDLQRNDAALHSLLSG